MLRASAIPEGDKEFLFRALRGWLIGSVLPAMLSFQPPATLAILLLIAPFSVPLRAEAPQSVQLPGGSDFRARMLGWSAQDDLKPPFARRLVQKERPEPAILPRLSSRFGYRGDPFGGAPRMHSGIDIPGAYGAPVLASGGGVVSFAGWAGGYGNVVEIDHGSGLTTRYAHLARIFAGSGALVAAGETIALIGSTGRSTGPHLHFEVRQHGRAANPLNYLGGAAAGATTYTVWDRRSEPHISQFALARAGGDQPTDGKRLNDRDKKFGGGRFGD